MPALPDVPKVVRIDFHQTLGEDTRVLNHTFWQYSGTSTLTDLTTALTAIAGHWLADWGTHLSQDLVLTNVEGTDLTSPTSPHTFFPAAIPGGEANTALPAGVASIMKFIVARRYRGGHSKMYTAGRVDEQLHDEQTWDAANAGQWQTDWVTFNSHIVSSFPAGFGAVVQVNVSYFQGFHLVTPPSGRTRAVPTLRVAPVVDPIIDFASNLHVASQRRRNLQSS
jgi:hypothetical protein